MSMSNFQWRDLHSVRSASYTCGYCGESISSEKAYVATSGAGLVPFIYICHVCNKPTFIDSSGTTPSAPLGRPVAKLPEDIDTVYEEIRRATSINAHTAAVMLARKLLMHIAVEKGAEAGKNFVFYVNYLVNNHYTPPNSTSWVDKIRRLGNGANHEIVIMGKEDSQTILTFLEMLLKFIYEFPEVEQEEQSE